MYFDSVQALIEMDGHGIYVWPTYAIGLIVIFGLLITPILGKRRFLAEQRAKLRREQAAKQHQSEQQLQASQGA